MKTETLRNLMASFEEDRSYLEVVALFEIGAERRAWFEQRAGMLAMIVDQVHGEIQAREAVDTRRPGEAQRFDHYLQGVLEDYLGFGKQEVDRAWAQARQAT